MLGGKARATCVLADTRWKSLVNGENTGQSSPSPHQRQD